MAATGDGPKQWIRFLSLSIRESAPTGWKLFGLAGAVIGVTAVGVAVAIAANPSRGAVVALVALLVLSLIGAYRLWDAERTRADEAQHALREAQSQLERRPSELSVELGLLLNRGNRLLWEAEVAAIEKSRGPLFVDDTPVAVRTIEAVTETTYEWQRDAFRFIRDQVGWDAAELFRTNTGVPEQPRLRFDAEKAPQEAECIRYLQMRVWRLQQIMERVR